MGVFWDWIESSPDVCWDGISGLELDDVTWDDLCGWDGNGVASSDRDRGWRRERPQRIHGLLRIEFLDETDDDVEDDDSSNDAALNVGADAKADGHGHDQNL